MFVWQFINKVNKGLLLQCRIPDCDCSHKLVVEVKSKKGVRETAEVSLENGCNAANIIETVRVAEIERVIISSFEHLSNRFSLTGSASFPVDSFIFQSW